ncbi:MAG: RNA-binding S4 domain-containing protein [Chitinophagales bacterium]|nr:RNA-binding S4 domain-containing protein [Chitinophagales bacterium]HPE98520.1 S4 domain-containing protein [Chitinophagales bacterium]
MDTPDKCRIDKWLWAVRLFKTRSVAAEAVSSGKVKVDGDNVKSAYLLTVGRTVTIRKGPVTYTYLVKGLIEKRVGAPIAVTMYDDQTPEDELLKLQVKELLPTAFRPRGTGRPTKKERRDIDRYRGSE